MLILAFMNYNISMKRIAVTFFIICAAVLAANPAAAQQEQDSESSMLPEIDPQDIEIRSQFRARFPGLKRQPILGFDPNPRVYQIDPDRTPFMETHEQVVANLPVSELTRPDPPEHTVFPYSSPKNVMAQVGFGSYASPEAQFWGVKRISSKSYVGGDFDYSSSDGHLDNEDSSFRFFDANGEYATKVSDKGRVGIHGGFKSSFNNMFDLPGNVSDDARKNYDGFNLGAEFSQFKNNITGWKADANIRYYNTELVNAYYRSGKADERVYNGSVAKRWVGSNTDETFTVKAGVKGGNHGNEGSEQYSWLTTQGGVEYDRLFNYATKVTVDASVYYTQNEFDDGIYLGPEVTVEHPLLDILTLKTQAGAKPSVKTLEQLHNENRFLWVENSLLHSYKMYGKAEAQVEYADQGAFNFGFQYQDISDYPIFSRANTGEVDQSGNPTFEFYETTYTDVYKVSAYASISHEIIPEKLSVNSKVYLQSPKMKDADRIPYEEKIGVNSGLTAQPVDGLTFEAWADYIGSRRTYQTNEKLDGFLLLGGKADVQITERFGAYIKLVNLLDQEYEVWQGYTERPFQAYGGLTVKL